MIIKEYTGYFEEPVKKKTVKKVKPTKTEKTTKQVEKTTDDGSGKKGKN